MRRPILYAVVAAAALGLAAAFLESSQTARPTADMVAAGQAFLATLDDDGRARAARAFDDRARFEWFFTPVARTGLPLEDMTLEQRRAALHLVQSATSSQGYLKATGVMHLERILGVLENRRDRRDPENYHFWIFGTPSADQPWGWRFEGHHLSLNFTSANGITVSTPAFIGANPAIVTSGPFAGWRLLANEEDKARALLLSLDSRQRARAIISETAPQEIITGNDRRARVERLQGLPVSEMTQPQRTLLMGLLSEYLDNMDPAIAAPRYATLGSRKRASTVFISPGRALWKSAALTTTESRAPPS